MGGLTEHDNRIVSMSFDNSDFEKNMQKSIQSLETFDQSLNKIDGKSLDSLTKAANNVKLDGISSAALAVQRSFSTMEIVGLTVIQNLTNAAIRFGRGLWANTFGQIKAGGMKRALNIEQASFLLEGLGLNVKQIKEDAMYAVEGTAYGFDEAAKAAAAFGASGVKAGDDMKQALLGVSGVAAMTGRDYQSISDIFTTIASNGKLMTQQLRQFSASGLNVSAALAKQLGKTEAQINDMVQKGKIDFATFSKAMNEAFGEHAKDANKTFTGALSNMKAALSRIGEAFATPYIENMIPVFNKLKDVINQVKKDLGPFIYDFELIAKIVSTLFTRSLDKLMNSGKIEKVLLSFRNIITSIALVLNEVGKAFREVFPKSKGFIETFYNMTKAIIPSKEALAGFREVFKSIFVVLRIGSILFVDIVKIIASIILYLNKWAQQMIGLASQFKEFLDPFIKWVNETKLIERTIYAVIGLFSLLVEKIFILKESFDKLAATNKGTTDFFVSIIQNVKNFIRGLWALISQLDMSTVLILTFAISMIFVIELLRQKFVAGLKTFTGLLYNIYNIVKGIGSTIFAFSNLLKSLRNLVNKMALSLLADIILKIAVSVGILALSMKLLSTMNVENLLKAGGALLFLFGVLIGSYAALQKLTDEDAGFFKLIGVSAVLITLSFAIITLTASMKLLSTMDSEGLKSGVIGIITITAAIVAISLLAKDIKLKGFVGLGTAFVLLSIAMTKIASVAATNPEALDKALDMIIWLAAIIEAMLFISNLLENTKGLKSVGFISFALSIEILAFALEKISTIASTDPNSLIMAMGIISWLSGIIGAMMLISELLNKTKGIKAAGFLFFALSIDILANAITKVAELAMIDQAALIGAVGVITILSIIVGAMMALSNLLNKTKGIKAAGFLFFALSIDILASTLKKIAELVKDDQAALLGALGVITVLTIIVGAMMALSNLLGKTNGIKSSGFLMFSFCIWLLGQTIANLARLSMKDQDALENAMFCIVMLTTVCILMMALSTKMDGIKSDGFRRFAASILVMSIAMNILTDAFNGEEGYNNLLLASLALLAMVGITALMMKISKDADRIKSRGMFTMASSMLVLSAALAIISLLDYGKIIAGSIAITAMAVALGFASRLMKDAKFAQIGFAIMSASMIALATALYILKDVDPDQIINITAALAGLTVVIGLLSAYQSNFSSGTIGFVVLAAGVVVLAAALKILADVPINQLIAVGAVLTVLTVVFGALGALASINVIAAGLVILSACLLALSTSSLLFASAVAVLLTSISDFLNNLLQLKDIGADAINNILRNIEALADGIINLAPKISMAISTLIGAVGSAILNAAPMIGLAGGLMVLYLIKGILEMIPSLLDSLYICIMSVNAWTEQHGEELYNIGYNVGYKIMKGMFSALEGASYAFSEYMAEEILPKWGISTTAYKTEQSAKEFADNWRKSFFDGLKKDDGRTKEAAEAIVNGLNIGIEKGYISYEEANAKLAEIGLEAFKDRLDIHSPSGEMEENGENVIDGLLKGVTSKEGKFAEFMENLAEKGIKAFTDKMGSADLLQGMFNYSGIDTENKSAFDKVEDLSKNGAWESSNHTIHSYVDRWKAEGYESADAWQEANKQLDPLSSMLEDIAKQMGINIDKTEELSEVTEDLGKSSEGTNEKLKEFKDSLKNSIGEAMHGIFDEVKEQEYISPEEMLNRMSANIVQVGTWARNIATLAARGMSEGLLNELKDMGPEGAAKVQAFVDMTDEQLQMANRRWKAAEFMPDYGTKEIEQAYRNAGFNASLGFSNGIDPNAANTAATQLGTNSLDALMTELDEHSPSGKTKQMGIWASQGLAIGLTSPQSQSLIKAQSLAVANILLNSLKNNMKPQSFQQLGVNVIQGFSTGISNSIPQILSKVTAFCGQIINAFQRVLRMHSPSKVMEELGEYTMDGFGIGFEDGAENVEKLSDQAANDILNQMKANIAAITNGWSEENAYQPVIRPVFDMEAINQGFTDIQSWFANSPGLSLNGNLSRLTPTTTDDNDASTQQIINAINGINNDDVVREISSLRDDISNLQSAITRMQVVLNTGALVGQLVEPMDKALGNRVLTNTRGRY